MQDLNVTRLFNFHKQDYSQLYLTLFGVLFWGYFGVRGSMSVFGRRKCTEVRVLRMRLSCTPCRTAFFERWALLRALPPAPFWSFVLTGFGVVVLAAAGFAAGLAAFTGSLAFGASLGFGASLAFGASLGFAASLALGASFDAAGLSSKDRKKKQCYH